MTRVKRGEISGKKWVVGDMKVVKERRAIWNSRSVIILNDTHQVNNTNNEMKFKTSNCAV